MWYLCKYHNATHGIYAQDVLMKSTNTRRSPRIRELAFVHVLHQPPDKLLRRLFLVLGKVEGSNQVFHNVKPTILDASW